MCDAERGMHSTTRNKRREKKIEGEMRQQRRERKKTRRNKWATDDAAAEKKAMQLIGDSFILSVYSPISIRIPVKRSICLIVDRATVAAGTAKHNLATHNNPLHIDRDNVVPAAGSFGSRRARVRPLPFHTNQSNGACVRTL